MNTFPPTAAAATPTPPATTTNEVRRFKPDSAGAPPAGWAWMGAASYEDGANYASTDAPVSAIQDAGTVSTKQVVQSNQAYTLDAGPFLGSLDGQVTLAFAWPTGFTASRLIAACGLKDGSGWTNTIVMLAKGALAGADALAAQVYSFDFDYQQWNLVGESTADCLTIDRNLAADCQAFASADGVYFVRSMTGDGLDLAGYVGVNVYTGAIVLLTASGSLATSQTVGRLIAADGLIAAATNGGDRLVRGRLFALDTTAGTVSATSAVFAAAGFDLGDTGSYDRAVPEFALGIAPGDGSLIISTESGMSRIVNDAGVARAFQVAGPHPIIRAATGQLGYPQRFASFCAAGLIASTDRLRLVGAQGVGVSNAGLELGLNNHLAAFSRLAYKQ